MDKKTMSVAASFAVVLGLTQTVAAAGVWSDALLRIRGAVDRNNDGIWTATDYTSANTEIPDVMHAAETAPTSAKIVYNMSTHADSNVRIVEQDVKLTAEGRTVRRPVLYFPQPPFVDGGVNKVRCQAFKLFNGTSPITNDQWTAIFRMKPEIFMVQKKNSSGAAATTGSSWFFNCPVQGSPNEMRLGIRTKDGNKTGFITLCTGNTTNNEMGELLLTNDWMEVSLSVSGRLARISCGLPGKMRRWRSFTISTGVLPGELRPSIFRFGDCNRGAVESADNGNADAFRGWLETLGIWNRALSDAEVVEAFGGGNPGIVRLGEEGGSAKMFAGAKATGAVTLDPTDHDQRLWPASFGAGAVVTVPFTVDAYRADKAQALRVVAQTGSAAGHFRVAIDGEKVGEVGVPACAADATAPVKLLPLKAKYFTQGDHVLTLTCSSASGDVKLDVVEIVGGWQAGDGTAKDFSFDSDTNWASTSDAKPWADTYYASSMNMKDCAYYIGGCATALRRDKVVFWNIPRGLAARAQFRLTFRILGGGGTAKTGGGSYTPWGRNIVTTINGTTVSTQAYDNKTYDAIDIPAGVLHDGLNEIRLAFDTLDTGYIWSNLYYLKVDLASCESDWKSGLMIVVM